MRNKQDFLDDADKHVNDLLENRKIKSKETLSAKVDYLAEKCGKLFFAAELIMGETCCECHKFPRTDFKCNGCRFFEAYKILCES